MYQTLIQHLPELALAAALAWGAGLRLYLVMCAIGLAQALGWISLPEHLGVLAHPIVIGASGFMAVIEMFADKIPWIDSIWDLLQTFIRIPAGAALAAAVFGDSTAAITLAAALLGGSVTATTHFAKTGTRAAVNTSPEPASNLLVSATEDGLTLGGLWLALNSPWIFLCLLGVFLIGAIVVLRLSYRGLRRVFGRRRAGDSADRTPAQR